MTGVFYVPLRWVERTPNKSQHTKLTLEKKILPPLLPGFDLASFRSRVRRSNQQAISALAISLIRSRHAGFPRLNLLCHETPALQGPALRTGVVQRLETSVSCIVIQPLIAVGADQAEMTLVVMDG